MSEIKSDLFDRRWAAAAATLFLLLLGCGSDKTPILDDDPPAVVALKKAGADVVIEPSMSAPDMKGRHVYLSDTSLEPELFGYLPEVTGLTAITLQGPNVTDEVLSRLPELKSATRLDLTGSSVTDEGLKNVKSLPSLLTLNLTDSKVTGPGLAELPPRVTGLMLNNLPIDDDDLQYLQHINRLTMVGLTGTNVTPDAVRKFKQGRPFLLTVGVKLN